MNVLFACAVISHYLRTVGEDVHEKQCSLPLPDAPVLQNTSVICKITNQDYLFNLKRKLFKQEFFVSVGI